MSISYHILGFGDATGEDEAPLVFDQWIRWEQFKDVTVGQAEAVEGRLLYLVRNLSKDPLVKQIVVFKKVPHC